MSQNGLSEEDVAAGIISEADWRGNLEADKYAGQGAAMHQAGHADTKTVAYCDSLSWLIQRRLLTIAAAIVKERRPSQNPAAVGSKPTVPLTSAGTKAAQRMAELGHTARWEGKLHLVSFPDQA